MIKCDTCDKAISRDETALNKKLLGKKIKQFLCIDCLSSNLAVDTEILEEKIQQFKDEGCTLFS